MISYLITDPYHYSSDKTVFRDTLLKAVDRYVPDMLCFRDKVSKNYADLAQVFIEALEGYSGKKFINTYADIAAALGFEGVHLPSDKLGLTTSLKGLKTIYSAHSLEEITAAKEAGISMVTFSPVFSTPNKGVPIGIEELKATVLQTDMRIIALGGIDSEVKRAEVEKVGVYGFASIRYFVN